MLEAMFFFLCFMSSLTFCMCIYLFIEVKSMQKSTHQIQYVPVESEADPQVLTKKEKYDPFDRDFDNII